MIIRIDDYPSGVRPIPKNHIQEFAPILQKFEDAGVYYFLGIVPMICSPEDFKFLSTLKRMIPALHGYDHLNPIYAPLLKEKGDPYNTQGLAGNENEFKGLDADETLKMVDEAIEAMVGELRCNIGAFIPPFNRMNEHVEDIIAGAGIGLILGENVKAKYLPVISSGKYYIWSNQIDQLDLSQAQCITLHLTWEWDLIRKGESRLDDLIKRIAR